MVERGMVVDPNEPPIVPVDEAPTEIPQPPAHVVAGKRMYRTAYRRKRDLERHPDVDPARLPATEYSASDNLGFALEDLAYLRSDERDDVADAWIDTRIEYPWERTDA